MSDGVMTTKEFFGKQEEEKDQNQELETKKDKNKKIVYKFKFPPAPLGKCQTVLNFHGEEIKIVIQDGIYEPPKSFDKVKMRAFKVFLLANGFEDASFAVQKGMRNKDAKSKKYEYIIGHPDNTVDKKITGNVSVNINGKDVKFKCKKGIIKTKDKKVYEAFIKKGWYEVSIEEK